MRKIFFVGPLPPPVHGFSVINKFVYQALLERKFLVNITDLAPNKFLTLPYKWIKFLLLVAISSFGRRGTLYLPISGGLRQLIDIAFALPAKFFGLPIFIHHHSYAYLNTKTMVSRFVFFFLNNSTHIVLSEGMKRKLNDQFQIPLNNIYVLSNSAFLNVENSQYVLERYQSKEVTIGFLSNITLEKGIFVFFDAIQDLLDKKISVSAIIAGPVSPVIKAEFESCLMMFSNVRYLGSVYGEEKKAFFSKIDLLLFPTLYVNEAEPVTLWEAMAHSVPVVALQRGCIKEMIPPDAGRVVLNRDDFVSVVAEEVASMSYSSTFLASRRMSARKAFLMKQRQSTLSFERLLHDMTGNFDKGAKN